MKKYFSLSLRCVLLLAVIFGCAALQAKRAVLENTFFASNPDLTVKVRPEYRYLGDTNETKASPSISGRDLRYNFESYLFIQPDKDQAQKAVVIQVETIETSYVSDFFRNAKNTIDVGTTDLKGKKFQYITLPVNPSMSSVMTKHIADQGYKMQFGMLKIFGRIYGAKGNTLVKIYYYEALDNSEFDNNSWKNTDNLTEKQKDYLRDFNERALSAFELIS